MKNKLKLVLVVFTASCLSVYSQLSEGGLPPSFNNTSSLRSVSVSNRMVSVNIDVDRLEAEDEIAVKNGSPLRIAQELPVDVDIKTTGDWTTLPDSVKIWRQSVTAEGAQGLIISYDDFYIPRGGKLFIYNKDKSQVLGAYTYKTNTQGGKFATELIYGDSFTLEYIASQESSEEPRLIVSSLGYMYNRAVLSAPTPNINSQNSSGSGYKTCRINVNCADGDNWQKQKRGVVLYFVKLRNAWYACTGSLINNTNQDGTPYMLSAWHCFDTDPDFDSLIAYFNFEFSGCENETVSPVYQTLVGVTPLVQVPLFEGSDQFLVKMNNEIPQRYKPYFNGWDRRNIASESGVVIHHPNFDVKKIVTYNRAVSSIQYKGSNSDQTGAINGHWKTIYDGRSVTEGGSSGSPLFNQDGLIVGTLTGGSSFCESPTSPDYYGKLWFGWDQYQYNLPAYGKYLKTYLDPLNKGVEVLYGYDPYDTSNIEEDIVKMKKELVLFPNPAESELNINVDSIIRKIKIFNMQGRQVFSQEGYNASTATIQTSTFNKGVYTISVETDSKKVSDKFIKK